MNTALQLFAASLLVSTSSACSFMSAAKGPSERAEAPERCVPSALPPAVDAVATVALAGAATTNMVEAASHAYPDQGDATVNALGLVAALVYGVSAGYGATHVCE